jgi:hypothetical protein
MKKPTQIQFALINLAVFAIVLPIHLARGDPPPLSGLLLIIIVGTSGGFGFMFLVMGIIFRILYGKHGWK